LNAKDPQQKKRKKKKRKKRNLNLKNPETDFHVRAIPVHIGEVVGHRLVSLFILFVMSYLNYLYFSSFQGHRWGENLGFRVGDQALI
jgi:hypothetical protein